MDCPLLTQDVSSVCQSSPCSLPRLGSGLSPSLVDEASGPVTLAISPSLVSPPLAILCSAARASVCSQSAVALLHSPRHGETLRFRVSPPLRSSQSSNHRLLPVPHMCVFVMAEPLHILFPLLKTTFPQPTYTPAKLLFTFRDPTLCCRCPL